MTEQRKERFPDLVQRLTIWADTRDEENGDEPDAGKNMRTGWLREAIAELQMPRAGQCSAELLWPDGTTYYCIKDAGHNLRHQAIAGKTTLKWAEPSVDYRKPTT